MFSITPSTGAEPCRATVIDLRTTRLETSEGIVTTTVPESAGSSPVMVARRSVPGGRSTSSTSSAPQSVSARNSRKALASIEPRHVCASAWVGASHVSGVASSASSRSMDMTRTPSAPAGGVTPAGADDERGAAHAEHLGHGGPVEVGVQHPDPIPGVSAGGGEVGRHRGFADAALAGHDRDDGPDVA